MLELNIKNFIHYCQVSHFSKKSIKILSERLHEFNRFISSSFNFLTSCLTSSSQGFYWPYSPEREYEMFFSNQSTPRKRSLKGRSSSG